MNLHSSACTSARQAHTFLRGMVLFHMQTPHERLRACRFHLKQLKFFNFKNKSSLPQAPSSQLYIKTYTSRAYWRRLSSACTSAHDNFSIRIFLDNSNLKFRHFRSGVRALAELHLIAVSLLFDRRLIDGLMDWLVGWSIDWFFAWLVDWWTDGSINGMIGCSFPCVLV